MNLSSINLVANLIAKVYCNKIYMKFMEWYIFIIGVESINFPANPSS